MMAEIQLATGLMLTVLTWLGLRLMVGAPLVGSRGAYRLAPLLLDGFAPFVGFALWVIGTGRPIMAGLGIASAGVGLGVADRIKRVVLQEPTLFADRSELIEVVRHPRLYLAFVGTGRMIAGSLGCVAIVGGLIWIEPPLWRLPLGLAVAAPFIAIGMGRLLFVVPTMPALLERLAAAYERWLPSRDPAMDAARFGLLASFVVQATLARHERPARQRAAQMRSMRAMPADAGPILLVQGESFMGGRRLHPALAALTPNFERLQRSGVQQGALEVPCWGANTIRSELAILAGLGEAELGLDRFNPYEHFARVPLPSLAQAARTAGYRTVCVHPYERAFYARDRVMPQLGFDEFIALESFAEAPRVNGYVTDVAVAERVAALVREHGSRLLVFAITMENHGPWNGFAPGIELPQPVRLHAQAGPLSHWLRGLAATDAMIPILERVLDEAGSGWLLFYGDHQPSLAGAFAALGHAARKTDYVIWSPSCVPGTRIDLPAEELGAALLARMDERCANPLVVKAKQELNRSTRL